MTGQVIAQIVWRRDPSTISAEAERRAAQAVTDALSAIEKQAQALCRVDTGALRDSISIDRESNLSGTVGPRGVNYAIHQEYGTSRMPAKAYMRPSSETVRPQFKATMEQITA